MALASTRPVVGFAESALRRAGSAGGGTPAAWWCAILTVGPLLGSFITEPAAMTICGAAARRGNSSTARRPAATGVRHARPAVRQRVDRRHADAFRRAAGADGGAPVGLGHAVHGRDLRLAGGRGILISTAVYFVLFRRDLTHWRRAPPMPMGNSLTKTSESRRCCPVPPWLIVVHLAFMAWTVLNAHYPRCSLVVSCSFSASRAPPRVSKPRRAQDAAARRLLPGRSRDPWRPAGLVDRAGARDLRESALFLGATASPRSTTTR